MYMPNDYKVSAKAVMRVWSILSWLDESCELKVTGSYNYLLLSMWRIKRRVYCAGNMLERCFNESWVVTSSALQSIIAEMTADWHEPVIP